MKKCIGILVIFALCLTFVACSGTEETKLKDNADNVVGSLRETKESGRVKKIEIFDNDGNLICEIVPQTADGHLRLGDSYGSVSHQNIANTYISKGYGGETRCISVSEWSSERKCMIYEEIILLNPVGQVMERYWYNLQDGSYNITKMETYLPNGDLFFSYEATTPGGWFKFVLRGTTDASAYFIWEFDAAGNEIANIDVNIDTGEIIAPVVPQD